jgi:hypothetical protein
MAKIQARKDKCTDNPILLGDISKQFPPTAKIVRIFTSSTFTGLYAFSPINQCLFWVGVGIFCSKRNLYPFIYFTLTFKTFRNHS